MAENTEVSPGLQGRLKRGWIELGVFHLVREFKSLFNPLKQTVPTELRLNFLFGSQSVLM